MIAFTPHLDPEITIPNNEWISQIFRLTVQKRQNAYFTEHERAPNGSIADKKEMWVAEN